MQHRRRLPQGNERRWSAWAGLGLLAALLGGLVFGCLNPRPEDDPSAVDLMPSGEAPAPSAPVRETCDDNPYLAGCDAAAEPGNADAPASPADGASSGEPADAGAAPPGDAGATDAGATNDTGSSVAD